MERFKVGRIDVEENVVMREEENQKYTDFYAELAAAISDVQKAEEKVEKTKKKLKKSYKKSKKEQKKAKVKYKKAEAVLRSANAKVADLEKKLKEEQICREYEFRFYNLHMKYESLLAKTVIQAISREMNLIAAMQHPETCKQLVDQYVAMAREMLLDNCNANYAIEGEAYAF